MGQKAFAQEAVIQMEKDDTLPIAPQRYDDAVEPPKENFTSTNHNDMWEKYENGELDQQAFVKLQDDYNRIASKDPRTRKNWQKNQKLLARKQPGKKTLVVKKDSPTTAKVTRDVASVKKSGTKKTSNNKKAPSKKTAEKKSLTKNTSSKARLPASLPKKSPAKAPAKKPAVQEDDFKPVN